MSDDREAFVPHPEGSPPRLIVPFGIEARQRIEELERQRQAVLDYVATLECGNCEHVHEEGDCGAAIPDGRACRCRWGPPEVAVQIRALLAERERPACVRSKGEEPG